MIGIFREETIAGITVLMLREGRIMNTNEFVFNKGKDIPASELLRMFVPVSYTHLIVLALSLDLLGVSAPERM